MIANLPAARASTCSFTPQGSLHPPCTQNSLCIFSYNLESGQYCHHFTDGATEA